MARGVALAALCLGPGSLWAQVLGDPSPEPPGPLRSALGSSAVGVRCFVVVVVAVVFVLTVVVGVAAAAAPAAAVVLAAAPADECTNRFATSSRTMERRSSGT